MVPLESPPAQPLSGRLTRLSSLLARLVPAARKPGPPSGAPIKAASTPTITRVPVTQVRASLGGQGTLDIAAGTWPPRNPQFPSSPAPATFP